MGYLLNTDETISNAVEWLDSVKPDWLDSIHLDTLDIGNPHNCVIGQVFGDLAPEGNNGFDWVYNHGYEGHRINMDTMAFDIVGYDIVDDDVYEEGYTSEDLYLELNEDWRQTITRLRETRK